MTPSVAAVVAGETRWAVDEADCLAFLATLPDASVDLVFGSPPYEMARLYLENGEDLGIAMDTEEWVTWMVSVFKAALRVCKGLVAFVVEGQTRDYRYRCGPALLMADLCRDGITLRKPPIYRRVGIPGSGGPDWLRNDYEWIICATNGGKLPWSDNTAAGHPPKWAPGGEMSSRASDGTRVNQLRSQAECLTGAVSSNHDGKVTKKPFKTRTDKRVKDGVRNGENEQGYLPPAIANPGNDLQPTFTADEVRQILAQHGLAEEVISEIIACKVGGGQMGSKLAHDNEAPFPEALVDIFVRSFCPPDGIVLDCFIGSGTTGAVTVREGRRFLGCDLRASQVALARLRLSGVTPPLFSE